MAQSVIKYTTPRALYAENKNIYLISGAEIIALDEISSVGYNRFALTISNYSISANAITIVNIYGSEDKTNYYLYKSNVFSGGVGPGATMHYEFIAMTSFIRVTIQTAGTATVDTFLVGNSGAAASQGGGGGGVTPGTPGSGTVQAGLIQFVNSDTANVVLSLPYTDNNYIITLGSGSNVVTFYDAGTKTGTGFTVYTSAPFTGEISYEVAHP